MAVDTGDHAFPNRTVGAKPVQQDEERIAVAALTDLLQYESASH
jgi:hypothetical protein